MTETEKQNIKIQCRKFIGSNKKLHRKFLSCMDIKLFVLGKRNHSLRNGLITLILHLKKFFCIKQFYSHRRGDIISQEEYKWVRKLHLTVKMENFKLYNFQDKIILCEIFARDVSK